MKAFDDLYSMILPRVPGCPEPLADEGILRAANTFCEETRLWRDHSTQVVNLDTDIAVPYGAMLLEVNNARMDGRTLKVIAAEELDRLYPSEDWRGFTEGEARYLTQTETETLRVVPNVKGELSLSLVLIPGFERETLPDFLLDRYRQVMVEGALAHIMAVPGQAFSNQELALMYEQKFRLAVDRHRFDARRGQLRARLRTKSNFM